MEQPPSTWKRPFFTIWTGQAFSLFGSNLVQFALVWWITKSTGSATVLASATLVSMLPQIILGPFAGALVDRWNRRLVMMVADSIVAVVSLILALLFFSGQAQLWHVLVAITLRSLGGAFHWPAMTASTSLMVPNEQLTRIAGLNQMLQSLMMIIAPPVGALAVELLPMGGVMMIDVGTAAVAVFTMTLVQIPQPVRSTVSSEGEPASLLVDVKEGLRYIAQWPGLRALLGMALIINFMVGPAFSLIPLLVIEEYFGTAVHLGLMDSFFGAGAIAGGVLLGAWGGFKRKIYTSLMGLAGMGIGILVMGMSPPFLIVLAFVGVAIAGLMNALSNGPLQAIVQSTVAPDIQGRVFSLITTATSLITPLSLMVAGPLSDLLGVRVWYMIGGVSCLVMAVVALFVPALIHIEEQGKELKQGVSPTP